MKVISDEDLIWRNLHTRLFGPPGFGQALKEGKTWKWLCLANVDAGANSRVGKIHIGNHASYMGDTLDLKPHGYGIRIEHQGPRSGSKEGYWWKGHFVGKLEGFVLDLKSPITQARPFDSKGYRVFGTDNVWIYHQFNYGTCTSASGEEINHMDTAR
jgi:hypothetical protein